MVRVRGPRRSPPRALEILQRLRRFRASCSPDLRTACCARSRRTTVRCCGHTTPIATSKVSTACRQKAATWVRRERRSPVEWYSLDPATARETPDSEMCCWPSARNDDKANDEQITQDG